MKMNLTIYTLVFTVSLLTSGIVSAQKKDDLPGKWNAIAPDAPEEYQKAIAIFTPDSVFITFDSINFIPGNSMEFKNDTLRFEIGGVFCTVKFEGKTVMRGMSNWSSGQSELTMTKLEATDHETKLPKP